MRKKWLVVFLSFLLVFQLTGCKRETAAFLHPYTDMAETIQYDNANSVDATKAPLFAENLCVVPVGSDTDKDGNLTGKAALLVDVTDKEVIYANNVFSKVYPASVTKIVTTLIVLKYGNLADMVTVSHNAANITEWGATKIGLNEGDKINMDALLTAFLVHSGNDAGIAIAEHIGGTEENFAKMMNEEAKKLGAVDSNFVNAHGLHDDKHYTTAYDIYLILNELLHYDKFLEIIATKKYQYSYEDKDGNKVEKEFSNTNRYINGREDMPEGLTVLGGKTGTTSKAGSCLVLYSKDAKEHQYLSFLFKTDSGNSLFSQMSYLLKMINR